MLTSHPCLAVVLLSLTLAGCLRSDSESEDLARSSETVQVADAALAAGDYTEAAKLYEKVSQSDPGSVRALTGLGRAYTATGQVSRAENALTRALELSPRNPAILNELGRLALGQSRAEAALAHYTAALNADRRNLGAFTGKAVTLDYLSRHSDAQEVYRGGLKLYPTNFVLMNNYALSQVLSGNSGQGIALMEELRKDPVQGDEVRANLAIAMGLEGRRTEAKALLKGMVPAPQIERSLAQYEKARQASLAGEPVGHLIFQ